RQRRSASCSGSRPRGGVSSNSILARTAERHAANLRDLAEVKVTAHAGGTPRPDPGRPYEAGMATFPQTGGLRPAWQPSCKAGVVGRMRLHQGEHMAPRSLRRGRPPSRRKVPVPFRTPPTQPQTAEDKDAAAIAAQLRALIPSSTDPARLEQMAREVEGRARRRC